MWRCCSPRGRDVRLGGRALSCATPVVTSRCGGTEDIVSPEVDMSTTRRRNPGPSRSPGMIRRNVTGWEQQCRYEALTPRKSTCPPISPPSSARAIRIVVAVARWPVGSLPECPVFRGPPAGCFFISFSLLRSILDAPSSPSREPTGSPAAQATRRARPRHRDEKLSATSASERASRDARELSQGRARKESPRIRTGVRRPRIRRPPNRRPW